MGWINVYWFVWSDELSWVFCCFDWMFFWEFWSDEVMLCWMVCFIEGVLLGWFVCMGMYMIVVVGCVMSRCFVCLMIICICLFVDFG